MRTAPSTHLETELWNSGFACLVGLDEAGRGALAGPVFAGAVVLPDHPSELMQLSELVNDSKQLTARARGRAFEAIGRYAQCAAVGTATNEEIDELGIAAATRLAWCRALAKVEAADYLLLDAFRLPESDLPQRAIVHGDALCLSIAAASVLAKVARDAHMAEVAASEPRYGFERNKGYGTREHLGALSEHGPCPLHRWSFAPVRQPPLHMPVASR